MSREKSDGDVLKLQAVTLEWGSPQEVTWKAAPEDSLHGFSGDYPRHTNQDGGYQQTVCSRSGSWEPGIQERLGLGFDTSEIVTGQTGDAPVPIFLFDTPSPPCLERRDMCQEKGGPKP